MRKRLAFLFTFIFCFSFTPHLQSQVPPDFKQLAKAEIQEMRLITEAYLKMNKYYFKEISLAEVERLFFRFALIAGTILKNATDNFENDLEFLIYETIGSLVNELKDPEDKISKFIHKRFLKRVVRENLVSKFTGIGIEVEKQEASFVVTKVYQDSSAFEEGVSVGDQIQRVNGKSVEGFELKGLEELLSIPSGEKIFLAVLRPGTEKLLEFVLTSRIIQIPSTTSDYYPEHNIGYIRISEFRKETSFEVEEYLKELLDQGITGLMLDLRGNDGGDLEQAVRIVDLFLPRGKLVCYFLKRSVGRQNQKTQIAPLELKALKEVVILVDEKSGSSSEIVAGSLRYHQGYKLIGKKTKGMGSLKNTISLSDGSALYLITSRTYLPNGETYDMVGLEPDILAETPEEQLNKALTYLGV